MCRSVRSGYVVWMLVLIFVLTGCSIAPASVPYVPEVAPVAEGVVTNLGRGETLRGWDMATRQTAETIKATKDGVTYMFWPTARDANGIRMLWGRACISGLCNKPSIEGSAMDTNTLKTTLAGLSSLGYTIKIYLYNAVSSYGNVPVMIYSEDIIERLEWKLPKG